MGHFDPKWQERLYEYVDYTYMDLFHPSTKRYYINYSKHPNYVDPKSFLVLNFAWKSNLSSLFIHRFRPKFCKVLRNKSRADNPLGTLKPDFSSYFVKDNLVGFLPFLFYDADALFSFLRAYQASLLFLINTFRGGNTALDLDTCFLVYLYKYLSSFCDLGLSSDQFVSLVHSKCLSSYGDLLGVIFDITFVGPDDVAIYRERVLAEYVAFERFYSLLVSEYGNSR